MSATIAVDNPDAAWDVTAGLWTYTADLTLPDGSAGHLEETRNTVAHQLYLELIAVDVTPAQWATPTGPVSDVDVARFLGGIAAVEQYAARQAVPATVTHHTGPNLIT